MRRHYQDKIRAVLPPGYSIGPVTGRGHLQILRPDGSVLRAETGVPVTIAWSPSDGRSTRNTVAAIRRALRAEQEHLSST